MVDGLCLYSRDLIQLKLKLKVYGGRSLSVFISRLDPTLSINELSLYIRSVHTLDDKCVKLKTKHDSYASFKINVVCNNASKFFNPENWPAGVYQRKFFNPKDYMKINITSFNCNGFKGVMPF